MTDPELLGEMAAAIGTPCGLLLRTSNPEKLRQRLYKLRREYEEFEVLSFIISPDNPKHELWVIPKG